MQERKRLEQAIADEAEVSRLTSDLDTLFELGREGENVTADLDREIQRFSERLEVLETGMLLNGPNDAKSAIMAIHPGAGGTESQDWAEMLLRMYLRWAERHDMQAVVTDRLEGEGAGIKSATLEINGENAYGLLQSEIGVHRLVRISPFDANARRHTSFASVFVYPADRRRHQHRYQAGGSARGCVSRLGRRRPACEPNRIGRPHDAYSDWPGGAVPERTIAA